MSASARRTNRPIDLLEESMQLLRSAGPPILLQHWIGSIPFGVALLILLHDVGLSWGRSLLLRDSLACAIAFVWLSYWRSRTTRIIFSLLSPDFKHVDGGLQHVALQTIFQTLKLFVMPFAVASVLAWPAASSFFRALALEPLSQHRPVRSGLQRALASATHQYVENAVAFLTTGALTLITWLNVLITLAIVPSLWKMLTGYETDWSRMQSAGVFGLLAVAAVATWLLVDPWIQTQCMLRIFYRNARSDGRDLLRDIARLVALALVFIAALGLPTYAAQQPDIRQAVLNKAIDRAAQGADYGWLRPQNNDEPRGFLADLAQRVNETASAGGKRVQAWSRAFRAWLRDWVGESETPVKDEPRPTSRNQELRWILGILGGLICCGIVVFFLRTSRIPAAKAGNGAITPLTADLLDEQILASDVNQQEWLRLAFEYLQNNQTRLSARAFYLANLSYLGTQSLLTLSLSKTNRIYERELARQPKSGELSTAFAASNRLYERAWYGMRELGTEQMELLKGAVDQLRHHA